MNAHIFMNELRKQVEAVKAIGETSLSWGCTFGMYTEAETKLLNFIKSNRTNLVLIMDECFNDVWMSNEDKVTHFIDLFETGDYDEALAMLRYSQIWKFRRQLEHLEITVNRGGHVI